MKIKGAVLREAGPDKRYSIEELEPPKEREVLIRYVYAGYCHSDLHNLLALYIHVHFFRIVLSGQGTS